MENTIFNGRYIDSSMVIFPLSFVSFQGFLDILWIFIILPPNSFMLENGPEKRACSFQANE